MSERKLLQSPAVWCCAGLLLTCLIYWPGLYGGWLLDDYSSIVDNASVHTSTLSLSSLAEAALSSTASEFRRPLASLSFALNYRLAALDPFWMKFTNLLIHLINGILVFHLSRLLMRAANTKRLQSPELVFANDARSAPNAQLGLVAAAIAVGWMWLPINLTNVLYVVQRMESLANAFVLLGLVAYVVARMRMIAETTTDGSRRTTFFFCASSVIVCTLLGLLAKETAVMLPLYAGLIELFVFKARRHSEREAAGHSWDKRIATFFALILFVPFCVGLGWLLPRILGSSAWSTRNFTMTERLLTEARVVFDYLSWTLVPPISGLKFYYDDFRISTGLVAPWTTAASLAGIGGLLILSIGLRRKMPMTALGLAFFLCGHLLTATILPLELVFEHRNYFASFGVLLALFDLANNAITHAARKPVLQRTVVCVIAALLVYWGSQTALNAFLWGSPLRLAQTLAARGPGSARAQYALGNLYSAYSQFAPSSPFVPLAERQLETAANVPGASILAEQALIYMTSRMHSPAKDAWWNSLISKLAERPPTVEDQSALRTLSICAIREQCDLSPKRMTDAFDTAIRHPGVSAQLYARYADYAWVVLKAGERSIELLRAAIALDPREADYHVALIRILSAVGRNNEARDALDSFEKLHLHGNVDETNRSLHLLIDGDAQGAQAHN